jgi:hypothetical protein
LLSLTSLMEPVPWSNARKKKPGPKTKNPRCL